MSEVEYREIPGFPGYRVGNDGTVWTSLRRGSRPIPTDNWRLLKPWKINGYLMVGLYRKRELKRELVHRLVLIAFVGECPEGQEACHDPDPDRGNCRLSNLRWDTRKANHADRVDHGTVLRGIDHPKSRLTSAQVLQIRERHALGDGYRKIAVEFGIDHSNVALIVKRKTWKHI